LVLLDARVFLGDSSAFDVSSLFLHHQEQSRGADRWSSSISASRMQTLSSSTFSTFFTSKKATESEAAIVVALELPALHLALNEACLGLKQGAGRIGADVETSCVHMQLFPLISAGTGSSWRVTVLGVTGIA
jgi:hypothetical protein